MKQFQIIPCFFPSKDSEAQLINFLDYATKTIKICVYTFTNKRIVDRILDLVHENPNLKVQVITDDVQTQIPSQKNILVTLAIKGENRISIRIDSNPTSLMHNKYVIIDDQYLATGSFNWTNKAVTTNKENLLLIHNPELASSFIENFQNLWNEFKDFIPQENDIKTMEELLKKQEEKLQLKLEKQKQKEENRKLKQLKQKAKQENVKKEQKPQVKKDIRKRKPKKQAESDLDDDSDLDDFIVDDDEEEIDSDEDQS